MKKFAVVAFVFGVVGVVGIAVAADPAGNWKWTTKFGDKEVERTMKLEIKDGKVTGTVAGGFGGKGGGKDSKIEEGTYKDGELKFTTVREGKDGQKTTTTYTGKYDEKADTIKLKIKSKFGDKDFEQDAEAKRVKDEKKKD